MLRKYSLGRQKWVIYNVLINLGLWDQFHLFIIVQLWDLKIASLQHIFGFLNQYWVNPSINPARVNIPRKRWHLICQVCVVKTWINLPKSTVTCNSLCCETECDLLGQHDCKWSAASVMGITWSMLSEEFRLFIISGLTVGYWEYLVVLRYHGYNL